MGPSHRLVAVFRGIFGNKALNAVSGVWAPVYKERHAGIAQRPGAGGRDLNRVVRLGQDRLPRCARCATDNRQPPFGIDLDQSSSPATRPGASPPTSPSHPTSRRSAWWVHSWRPNRGVVGLPRLDPGQDLRRRQRAGEVALGVKSLMNQRIEVALADCEEVFRARETNKRMKDKAAHACRTLCRARVAEELQQRTGNAEHFKLVLSIIDRQVQRIEALCEPAVDRSEHLASLIPLALIAHQSRAMLIAACHTGLLPTKGLPRRFR